MLRELTFFGEVEKVKRAIETLKMYEPEEEGYFLAFSGGKDSVVIKKLSDMAGVKYDAHYSLTTVDPPELIQFIRTYHRDVIIEKPAKTMWELIEEMGMPPLRQMRYCCRILKETYGEGRRVITGVRKEESAKRQNRRVVEQCYKEGSNKIYVNPILDWSEAEVWEFIKTYNVPYCKLYDEGWKRLGCICCPNGNQKKQAQRWPKIADAYRRACIRAFDKAVADNKPRSWKNGEEMFRWWISGQPGNTKTDQTVMFE